MKRLLISLSSICALLLWNASFARANDDAILGALIELFVLPTLKEKVVGLDKDTPTETNYGLKGPSVGRNGLREEVDNHDIVKNGKKVNETRYNFFDKFAWAEKGGTFGPPGFQYYIFRHPLILAFDPKNLEFTASTKLEFKVAVAINFDTGILGIKPWIFADSGFGGSWPNTVDISIKSKIAFDQNGKLSTNTTTQVSASKPIVLQTLHGLAKKDCSPEVLAFLKAEMEKIATKIDAEVAQAEARMSAGIWADSKKVEPPVKVDLEPDAPRNAPEENRKSIATLVQRELVKEVDGKKFQSKEVTQRVGIIQGQFLDPQTNLKVEISELRNYGNDGLRLKSQIAAPIRINFDGSTKPANSELWMNVLTRIDIEAIVKLMPKPDGKTSATIEIKRWDGRIDDVDVGNATNNKILTPITKFIVKKIVDDEREKLQDLANKALKKASEEGALSFEF